MSDLKILFLGTAGAIPTTKRNLISSLIIRDGELFIFDIGEGMQQSMMKCKVGMNRKTSIFISHLHGDHILGILGLIQSMSLLLRDKPLYIYGPKGLSKFIRSDIKILNLSLNFKFIIREIDSGLIVKENDYKIYAKKGKHSITNYSYIFVESDRPGKFHISKVKKLGIPEGTKWSSLQRGKSIQFKGKTINSSQVLGKPRPGRKIGISGDTRPTKQLTRFFSNCDVLIHESTFSKEDKDLAKDRFHSTSVEAAIVAKNSNSNLLLMTHFSSRYVDLKLLEKQARSVHKNAVAAVDFLSFYLPYPDEKKLTRLHVLEQTNR